jgi:hypothetical protein
MDPDRLDPEWIRFGSGPTGFLEFAFLAVLKFLIDTIRLLVA